MHDRDLLRVVAARFISRAGGEAAFFIGVWGKAAYDFHASAGQLALLMAVLALASIAGSLFSGVLVDRYDPRRVLLVAEAFFVPVTLLVAFSGSLAQLTFFVGLLGFTGAPVITAVASMAPFLKAGHESLERVNAWIEGAGSLSYVAGPAIGALLVTVWPLYTVFVLDAVTSLVAVVLVGGVHLVLPDAKPAHERRHPLAELSEGMRVAFGDRRLRFYLLIGSAAWIAFGSFGALEPLFYRDVVHTGIQTIGWASAVFGAGLILGTSLLPRAPRRLLSARGVLIMGALTGVGAIMYVGTADLRIIMAGAVAWGAVIGLSEPLLRTLIQAASPVELIGRITGATMMLRHAAEFLPLAFAPALAAAFGVQPVLIGGGLILVVVAMFAWPVGAGIDRLPVSADRLGLAGLSTADEPISPNP